MPTLTLLIVTVLVVGVTLFGWSARMRGHASPAHPGEGRAALLAMLSSGLLVATMTVILVLLQIGAAGAAGAAAGTPAAARAAWLAWVFALVLGVGLVLGAWLTLLRSRAEAGAQKKGEPLPPRGPFFLQLAGVGVLILVGLVGLLQF